MAAWFTALEGKMKRKRLLLWMLLLVVLTSEGCATIRGMGEDIQSIGERREKGSLRRIVASLTKAHSIPLDKTSSKKEYHVLVATEWHEEPRHILLENTVAPCRWRKISLILVVGQRRLLF